MCGDYSGFANAVAFVCALGLIVVFHGEHYTLLMLATVALFSTACIALNLQLAFAGIANFAGAAFFVLGSYTAAVMTAYAGIPHLMILVVSGIVTGAIGVILLLPVLRTRGHYAALVTIAFGLLLRSLLEVNDTLGGPQGMKIKGWPELTLSRGEVVWNGKEPTAAPGRGQFLPCDLPGAARH